MEFKSENISYNREVRDMYDHFMVFELLDTGERQQLNISEDEFRRNKGKSDQLQEEQKSACVWSCKL